MLKENYFFLDASGYGSHLCSYFSSKFIKVKKDLNISNVYSYRFLINFD